MDARRILHDAAVAPPAAASPAAALGRPAMPPGAPAHGAAPPGVDLPIRVAATPLARLRGLLGHRAPPPFALRLDGCRCVHTVGMRFALDLHWVDASGAVVRVDRGVPPGRVRACRRARAVVEVPAGGSILRQP